MNESISNEAVYRTALATPGLLKTLHTYTHSYNTVHACTHLYQTVHNCTHLYRAVDNYTKHAQYFTQLYTPVYTRVQDSTHSDLQSITSR